MDKEKIQWSKEAVLILIKRFRQHDSLYDPGHQMYNNKQYRTRALRDILDQVVCFYPKITVNDVRTKLNYLRTQFCRENQKIMESTKNATCEEDIYVPTAYWFDDLCFLKKFIGLKSLKTMKLENNSESSLGADETLSFEIYNPSTTPEPEEEIIEMPPSKKRKKFEQEYNDVEVATPQNVNRLLNTAKDLLTEIAKIERPQDGFNDSLIMFLKENIKCVTDPELKDDMAQKIIEIVLDYKKKQRNLR